MLGTKNVEVGQKLTMQNGKEVVVEDISTKMGLIIGGQEGQKNNNMRILHAWSFDGEHVDGIPGYGLLF